MKKIMRILMLFLAMFAFTVSVSHAQSIYVGARIGRPHPVVRPVRPSPRHVWVGEEWVPQGGTYVYKDGYWAEPPHPGGIWIAGHWRHRRQGWIWIAGYWR
jgi:hypothetical protein